MSERFYETIAGWYDLEFEGFDADLDLYRGYASVVGGPILELGCGTGRLLLPLAQAGYDVFGIDTSVAMIEQAAARIAGLELTNCCVEQANMLSLGPFRDGQFRLVFSAINSFLHLSTRAEQLIALGEARRVLHPDGILILDLFHPAPPVLQSMDDRLLSDGRWELADGSQINRFSHRRVHAAEQRIDTSLYYDHTLPDGSLRRVVADYSMRYIHRFELEGLLHETGLELEGIYGSYGLDAFDDSSSHMIFVAHRR